jgi:hypothetical protein
MTAWNRDLSHVEKLQALSTPEVYAAVQGADLPDELGKWIGKLCVLDGVPFNHLVPDERMLPRESLRFFYVDQNWLDSLVDGAFSAGKGTTRDDAQHAATLPAIRQTAEAAALNVRNSLRGLAATANSAPDTMTGLLLRSALVSGWPGLEVKAFQADCVTQLDPLRIERLAPDVLLCIFNGSAGCIHITEPAETLHFGLLKDDDVQPAGWQITLRYLESSNGHTTGQQLTDDPKIAAVMRKDAQGNATRVLNINGTGGTLSVLESSLQNNGTLAKGTNLSPAAFAIQMVEAAEQQEFKKGSPAAPTVAPLMWHAVNARAVKRELRVADLIPARPDVNRAK